MIRALNLGLMLLATFGNLIVCTKSVNGQNELSVRDITVLKRPDDTMMRSYLTNIVDKQFAVRDSLLSTLKSARQWNMRSQAIRDSMISWTGPFPERTPLNAQITGRLDRKDYIVEKVLFESRPHFFVSADLYLPKNVSFPRPALLNVIGHTSIGKFSDRVQTICISAARKGFVALAIDCIGQGERQINEYASYGGRAPGNAHNVLGLQAFISGTNIFNFMVWDAIRAIDYLISLPEVDSNNICITGASGGGMMSEYILPFDDRIKVSIPTCSPNTWSYRVHANLKTDYEQIFFGAFTSAIDPRSDPLFAHAPKPLLINATTDDHLNPPRGVWDLSTWLYKYYSALGAPEKFTTTMVHAGHGYNQEQREISYSWILRWTGGNSADFWEGAIAAEKANDLWATPAGNVYNMPGSRDTHELILDYLKEHEAKWKPVKTQNEVKDHRSSMLKLVKDALHTDLDHIMVKGSIEEAHTIGNIMARSFVLKPEEGIRLPGILLASKVKDPNKGVVLYIDGKGKSGILHDMDIVKGILNEGYSVCAIDLRGIGETAPDAADKSWDFLAGKPIFGQRVRDVLATIKWLKGPEIRAQNIKLWGKGMGALYGAFAGVLNDDVAEFLLEDPLISFKSVVEVKVPGYHDEILLPGILEKLDMPQVYQALCSRPVMVLNPYLGNKTPAGKTDIEKVYEPVSATYKVMKRQTAWQALNVSKDERAKIIAGFLEDN